MRFARAFEIKDPPRRNEYGENSCESTDPASTLGIRVVWGRTELLWNRVFSTSPSTAQHSTASVWETPECTHYPLDIISSTEPPAPPSGRSLFWTAFGCHHGPAALETLSCGVCLGLFLRGSYHFPLNES